MIQSVTHEHHITHPRHTAEDTHLIIVEGRRHHGLLYSQPSRDTLTIPQQDRRKYIEDLPHHRL